MHKASSHHVISSGFKLFYSQFLQNIFLLGIGVYFAHVLSIEEMAVVSLFVLFTALIPTIASIGLIDLILWKLPIHLSNKETKEASSLIRTVLSIQFLVSFFLSLAMILFAKDISMIFLKTSEYAFQIQIIGLGAHIQTLIVFFDAVIRSLQQFGKVAKAKFVANVISRIVALILFFLTGFNGYLGGLLIGSILTLIMLVHYSRQHLSWNASIAEDYKHLIRFSFPYYLSNISRYIVINIDKYIVGLFLSPSYLATYFVASRIVEYLKQIIDSLMNPIFPKIAELKAGKMDRIENAFLKSFRYLTFLFLPLSFGGAALSYQLLYLYGGARYTGGTVILAILFVSMIGYTYSGLLTINIHIMGKPMDKLKLDLAGGIISIVLSFILVYLLKDTGVALSKFAAYFGSVLAGYFILRKIITVKFDLTALKLTTAASGIMALIIVIPQIYIRDLLFTPIFVILGVTTFFLILLPKLQQSDKELIMPLVPKRLKWLCRDFVDDAKE
jgi:O-antigen/teichoic acid export membrane protein